MEGREIFWNIHYATGMYVLALVALLFFFHGLYSHWRFWMKGDRRLEKLPVVTALKAFLSQAFFQKRILQETYSGLMHLFIFWGCLVLFLGTILLAIDYDLLGPLFGLTLLHGPFYLIYSFALDLFGLVALLGIGMALIRRYFLQKNRTIKRWPDGITLWILFLVLITGFFIESLRIVVTGMVSEWWSPIGFSLASPLRVLFGLDHLRLVHAILWSGHLILALVLIAIIPYTRLFHMVSASFLMLSRTSALKGTLEPVFSEPLEVRPDRLVRFPRHHLIGLDACTQCGRCEEICPINGEQEGFSPMKIMEELKKGLWGSNNDLSILKETGAIARVWECLTCRSCEAQCPISLELMGKIIELRRNRVMAVAHFPTEIKSIFRNLETFGDPWGMGGFFREDWILEETVRNRLRNGKGLLVWIGCQSTFHERSKKVTWSFMKLLDALNVEYFLLGKEEMCCGDLARRTGNEYLCRSLILKNIETFQKYGVEKIVTLCPHCFHSLKEEYPYWGGRFEVIHYTELIADLIKEGKLSVQNRLDRVVTYHDSCYLGRYHSQYDGPRSILKKIMKGELLEMEKNRATSLCCGAGGGSFWLRGNTGEKINGPRLNEIREKKVQVICTSCPYCLVMFEEATRNKEAKDGIAMDLIELLDLVL